MATVLHRYVRRMVVWAQTFSDEEAAWREFEAKLGRRKRIARNARNALLTGKSYPEWRGIGAEDAANLIEDVKAVAAADPLISREAVDVLVSHLNPCTYTHAKQSNEGAIK